MFATRSESSSSARELGDGRHLLNAYICGKALSDGVCRSDEPSPPRAHSQGPTLSKGRQPWRGLSSYRVDLRANGVRCARHSKRALSLFANALGVAN